MAYQDIINNAMESLDYWLGDLESEGGTPLIVPVRRALEHAVTMARLQAQHDAAMDRIGQMFNIDPSAEQAAQIAEEAEYRADMAADR